MHTLTKWTVSEIYSFNADSLLDVEMDMAEPIDILDSDSFTCVIDKGTLDCVACSDEYTKRA